MPQLEVLLQKLKDKTSYKREDCFLGSFFVDKTLNGGHSLPITNVSIDKHGQMWEIKTIFFQRKISSYNYQIEVGTQLK